MSDLTSSVSLEKVPYSNWAKIGEDKCYDIDLSVITDGLATGTHNLVTIPVGSALMDAAIVVKEAAASSGGAATVQFKIGSETLSAAIPQADLAAGKIIRLDGNQYTGVVTENDGAVTPAVAASGTTGVEGSNNGLTYTADVAGVDGNEIYIKLVDPAGNDQSLSVSIEGQTVNVSLATGPAGAITSTAAEVLAAINADGDSPVTVSHTGASTGAAAVAAATENLSGGTDASQASDTNTLASIDVDAGVSAYCPSTADTLDMVVAGEALTALRFALVTKIWDVDKALGNA